MSTDIDTQYFKSRLLALQQEFLALESTNEEATHTVELDQTRVGRLSRMDALQGQAMSIEAQRRRQIELKNIAAALKRIEDNDYGYCMECGEDIPNKRLEIDPATAFCINCAEKAETSAKS